ncbi:acylneuraminate cytidylyltransferase family protein [Prolixibacteraceae bacterium JC049]|nr:acylneuraminate cytidylyltransferase family protein [Prolixibacteraceae bacterium JC049]
MKVLCVIPARGGSKGVPHKNIVKVDGKPLLGYSIEAALACEKIDDIVVSSDDDNILRIAGEYEEIKLHKRDAGIAKDNSPVTETLFSLLDYMEENYDAILILQVTSPIRTSKQIDEAIELLKQRDNCNSLISVVPMQDQHPARMYWKEDGMLKPVLSTFEETRRQDIPTAWYRNGAIYIVRTEALKKERKVMVKPSIGYPMPFSYLLNIDEPRDLLIAEVLIKAWKKGELDEGI